MDRRWCALCVVFGFALLSQPSSAALQQAAGGNQVVAVRVANADGIRMQYLTAGHGPALVLLHGYAETSRMWRPLIPQISANFTVIAPDLPGIGASDIPSDGLDMTHAAVRVHALVRGLGITKAAVVGHDIGLMVAYAYAAQYPTEVDRLVLMDAFLPGVDGWEPIYNNPGFWHFRFNGPTAEALVKGRERTYFEHFWNDFAADKTRSIPEADRRAYTALYAKPGRMRSAWAYFVSFQQAAKDFAAFAQRKLSMPVLSIGGEKALGDALGKQVKLVASNASTVTLPNTGHWIMEERPRETTDALVRFLGVRSPSTSGASASGDADRSGERASRADAADAPRARLTSTGVGARAVSRARTRPAEAIAPARVAVAPTSTMPQLRLTPDEVRAQQTGSEQIGSSGLAGVSTQVLVGDPAKRGFYTIILFVPPHTSIPAHSHRDDRTATVVSGTWQFGYGDRFDEHALKNLPVGSVYSEPGRVTHFARTGNEPVLVQISGIGPTDTKYVNPADTPKTQGR